MNPFELFKEDWSKIPQSHRYLFIIGSLLIFFSWLLDHWGAWQSLNNPSFLNYKYLIFYFAIILILIGIFSLLFRQAVSWKSIGFIRFRYPRSKLGKTFKIIESEEKKGKLYLYDLKDKRKYWIASGQTYRDLGYFWGDAVTFRNEEFEKIPEGPLILTSGNLGS